MDNKTLTILAAISSASVLALHGEILTTPQGVVVLDTKASAKYDTNIFATSAEESDYVFTLSPELRYIQDRGLISMEAATGVNVIRYADNDDEDGEDFFANLTFAGPNRTDGGDLSYSGNLGYTETTSADPVVGTVTEAYTYSLGASADYNITDKTGVRVGGGYTKNDYEDGSLSESETYNARIDGLYYYSQKLTLKAGYSYSTVDQELGVEEIDSHNAIIGAEGDLTDKLSGTIEGGIQYNDATALDQASLYYLLGLDWAARDKTNVSFSGRRGVNPTATGAAEITTTFTTSVSQQLTDRLSASAFATLGQSELEGVNPRKDDYYRIGAGVTTEFTANGSIGFSLSYEDRDGENSLNTYERVIATLNASYTF